MPKNNVSDPITDQEMTFARLLLRGGITDRQAAEAVGLNPDSAAYTKSKPHVRAYMLEYRASVLQQSAQQEADAQHRLNLDRERVLARLWAIADLSPETTRGSATAQVKALSMIIAMQNFIHSGKNSAPKPFPLNPQPTPASAQAPPDPGPAQSTVGDRLTPSDPPKPYSPLFGSIPDLGIPLPIKNPFVHPR